MASNGRSGAGAGGGAGAESTVLEETIDENYEPTAEEIAEYAKWLGMDLEADKHLFWVAREGLKAPLPSEWKPCQSPEGELYYFNFQSGESVWDHPCDEHYRSMYQEEKKKNPKPAPETKDKDKKKRPKKSGSSGSSSAGGSAGGTELKAVVAPKDRSNLASAADLLGPVSVGGNRGAATASSGLPGLSTGLPMEKKKGLLDTQAGGAKSSAPAATSAAASASSADGPSEEQLQKEFEQWEAEQTQQHEKAKAELLQRIAAKNNDEQSRELDKQAAAEIRAIKIEQDKLRREKSDIETRSPVVKPGGSGQDELERSRAEMTIEKEKLALMQQLTAAEYEERNKLMAEEKQAVENAARDAENELRQELSTVESQHQTDLQQAKVGYEHAKQRADSAGAKVGQVAAQKESTLLLKETERYTAELSEKLKTARAEAEAEIEAKLAEAKVAQDTKADEQVKAERVKLDAEREKLLQETKEMMELKTTKLLREVSSETPSAGSGDTKDVTASELSKARKEFELKATKAKSALQDKLDLARTEARQGLPAAELKLKTQLSDELDELENDFRKQLQKEREAANAGDDAEEVVVTALSAAKEAELRAWKEEHEKASMDGIAVEVAELEQQNKRALENADGDAKANTQRITAKRTSLARELEQEQKRLADSTTRSVSAARTMLQEANTRESNRTRMQLQAASDKRTSELSAKLQRESATAGATLEKERARVEAELEAARVERLASLKRVKAALAALETAEATEDTTFRTAQEAQQKLKAELAAAPVATAATSVPSGLQAAALQEAESKLVSTKSELQSELAEKRAQYAREEAALREELQQSMAAKATAAATPSAAADSSADLDRKYSEKREQYDAQLTAELTQARTAERQAQEAAEASMAAEFTALERRLQAAMGSGQSANPSAGRELDEARAAANTVAQELATVEQEERMLVATIEAQKNELTREQGVVSQLEEQAIAVAAASAAQVDAQPTREAWGETENQTESAATTRPLGPSDANRQPVALPVEASKQSQPAQQTWAEPVVRELGPAAEDEATYEPQPQPERTAPAGSGGPFDSERRKLEHAKAAASKASRALQARQQQWEARRDEWLGDMRSAKRSGQPQASEFLRGVKSTLDDQANALNVEAKKLNKKKKQIRQMTQQVRTAPL
jgi:centrosomal protein CEP164